MMTYSSFNLGSLPGSMPATLGASRVSRLQGGVGAQGADEGEFRQRLIFGGELHDFVHGVAAAGEELVAAAAGDGDRHLLSGGFLQLGVGEQEGLLRTASTGSASGGGEGSGGSGIVPGAAPAPRPAAVHAHRRGAWNRR